jgi:hypothetical protein
MRKHAKSMVAFAGVVLSVLGLLWGIPLALQERYGMAATASAAAVAGLFLLYLAFGD